MHVIVALRFIRSFYRDERERLLDRAEKLFYRLDDFKEHLAMGGMGHFDPIALKKAFIFESRPIWVKGKWVPTVESMIGIQSIMLLVYGEICNRSIARLDEFGKELRLLTPEMVGCFHPMLNGSGYEPPAVASKLYESSSSPLIRALLEGVGTEGVIEGLNELSSQLDLISDMKGIETREADKPEKPYRLLSVNLWKRYGESLRKTQVLCEWDLLKCDLNVIRLEFSILKMHNLMQGKKFSEFGGLRLRAENRNIFEMSK
jgi:hypothetical protein